MEVIKRDGTREPISFDKVSVRIKNMLALPEDMNRIRSSNPQLYKSKVGLKPLYNVNVHEIAKKVISGIYNGVHTTELDDIAALAAQPRSLDHPEYGELASRIAVSNHHKNNIYDLIPFVQSYGSTPGPADVLVETELFTWAMRALYWNTNDHDSSMAPAVAPYIVGLLEDPGNRDWIESQIDYARDYNHDLMGFKLLTETYLLKTRAPGMSERRVVERPQHMFMRVAMGIHCAPVGAPDWRGAVERGETTWSDLMKLFVRPLTDDEKFHIARTYEGMSRGYFTHATPTLFNAGTLVPQLSSCYLITPDSDSIEGIADWWKTSALLSKWAGGVGSHIHKLRAKGSYIAGTGGTSNGIKPWLKTADQIAVGVDQGGNKRPGSHAIYLAPWHADIMDFLSLRKIRGNDEDRARNLFYSFWKNDEFMRCLQNDDDWYLMCPRECPGLEDVYDSVLCTTRVTPEMLEANPQGFAFTKLYRQYVQDGRWKRKVTAREIWDLVCEVTIETGVPYQNNSDAVNRKSNQTHSGTVIKSSNLCNEIMQRSNSVCNLTSICLPAFVRKNADGTPTFDFEEMQKWVRVCVYNLNRIIDINFYPVPAVRKTNMSDRPMGIGDQGLADVFTAMRVPFDDSPASLELDFRIAEAKYLAAVSESARLAADHGTYDNYDGSPVSRGLLQPDRWVSEHENSIVGTGETRYDPVRFPLRDDEWAAVRKEVAAHGLRNSLLIALMPTGSTSTIMGNSPCFEPHNSMVYKRRNRAGEFTVVNTALIYELIEKGLWSERVKNQILSDRRGSIADVAGIPKEIKDVYKTCWDISPRVVLEHAAVRAPFVDQSQSMNLFIPKPTPKILTQVHFFAWRRGLPTASYYTRRLPAMDAQKTQIVNTKEERSTSQNVAGAESSVSPDETGFICYMEDGCVTCSS